MIPQIYYCICILLHLNLDKIYAHHYLAVFAQPKAAYEFKAFGVLFMQSHILNNQNIRI